MYMYILSRHILDQDGAPALSEAAPWDAPRGGVRLGPGGLRVGPAGLGRQSHGQTKLLDRGVMYVYVCIQYVHIDMYIICTYT